MDSFVPNNTDKVIKEIYCSHKIGDTMTLKFVALTKIMEHI